jgi:hypothetical protein
VYIFHVPIGALVELDRKRQGRSKLGLVRIAQQLLRFPKVGEHKPALVIPKRIARLDIAVNNAGIATARWRLISKAR